MQKSFLKFIALLCFCVIIFNGCKKSSSPVTKTTLISKDSWKFSTATVTGVGDVSAQIPACYKDNVTTFISDGTGTIEEGGNVCTPSTATIFSWDFQSSETILHMTANLIPGGNGNFSINALSETTLTLSQETTLIPSPVPLTMVITFVHP